MTADPNELPSDAPPAPLTPLRALLLLAVVIGFFAIGELWISLFAAVVWLLLVALYGRRAA
ncbi:MAG: hypothetical protein IPN34_25235 [Planctomycetes bacterium]|nr:hypothetical protein [Planctomycetota bacterium]